MGEGRAGGRPETGAKVAACAEYSGPMPIFSRNFPFSRAGGGGAIRKVGQISLGSDSRPVTRCGGGRVRLRFVRCVGFHGLDRLLVPGSHPLTIPYSRCSSSIFFF